MAVYTEIDSNTLAEIAAQYPLSQVDEFKGITAGVQNSNFLLTTAERALRKLSIELERLPLSHQRK